VGEGKEIKKEKKRYAHGIKKLVEDYGYIHILNHSYIVCLKTG
jgi:hypothetical protein